MRTKEDLLSAMKELRACLDATQWVETQEGSAQEIWDRCERGDWMLWLAAKLQVDRKLIVKAACLCARTALKYVRPGEDRPLKCIETTERWVRGEATIEEVREARRAAVDAAYAAAYAASAAAAYAAAAADAASAAAASAAAYAAAAAAASARQAALKQCADIVRTVIVEVPQ